MKLWHTEWLDKTRFVNNFDFKLQSQNFKHDSRCKNNSDARKQILYGLNQYLF